MLQYKKKNKKTNATIITFTYILSIGVNFSLILENKM